MLNQLFKEKTIPFLTISAIAATGLSLPILSPAARSSPIVPEKEITSVKQNKAGSGVGEFKLVYSPNTQHRALQKLFQTSGIFAKTVEDLNNQNLNLPVDIPIIFEDCGMANAYYSPAERSVTMCYEMFDSIAAGLAELYPAEEVLINATFTQVFVLYHEVGHALTDILQLAVTGREEDAVDDFASILLLRNNNSTDDDIVLNASLYFSSRPDGPYWGEHSFGQQRFYNVICLLYGRNPEQYGDIPEKVGLSDRAPRCPSEYQQKLSSWERLLAPHSIHDASSPSEVPGASDEKPQPLF